MTPMLSNTPLVKFVTILLKELNDELSSFTKNKMFGQKLKFQISCLAGATTFSKTTLSVTTLSITTLSITHTAKWA
jgi:hypothetical protein